MQAFLCEWYRVLVTTNYFDVNTFVRKWKTKFFKNCIILWILKSSERLNASFPHRIISFSGSKQLPQITKTIKTLQRFVKNANINHTNNLKRRRVLRASFLLDLRAGCFSFCSVVFSCSLVAFHDFRKINVSIFQTHFQFYDSFENRKRHYSIRRALHLNF